MKYLYVVVLAALLGACHCMPKREVVKNNMSSVALKLLGMLSGGCQMYDYTDTVRRRGCEPIQIQNKFCGGKCMSRYYPGYSYCSACMPGKFVSKKVFFKCPSDPVKKIRHRRIQIVVNCQCRRFMCKK